MKNTTKLIMTITGARPILSTFALFTLLQIANAQSEEAAIKTTIERFFEGFTKADTSIIMSTIDAKKFSLQTVMEKNGKVNIHNEQLIDFIEAITAPKKEQWVENIESYKTSVDGNFANAWCKYTFYVDTTFFHWGIDNIQLIKIDGKWKIFSIADTRNKKETYEKPYISNLDATFINLYYMSENQLKDTISLVMNNWHKAAATGDEKIFFGSMDSSCIYLGTDKTEYWTKQAFETWSKKHFDKDKAWDFTPYDRHVYFSDDKKYAWFDELLETWMGVSRGSGVLEYSNGKYKLVHYNLAVTIANEKIKEFVKINK